MNLLMDTIEKLKKLKILVFGDIILDEYVYGTVDRISQEAPVPIVDINFTEHRLGGCGNTVNNIAALGGQVSVFSVMGKDSSAAVLRSLLEKSGITDRAIEDPTRPTIKKSRLVAHKQQIARLDWEKKHPVSKEIEALVMKSARDEIEKSDIVILSDYEKGFLTPELCKNLINMAKDFGKRVVSDPKSSFFKYAGSDVITPNFSEFLKFGPASAEKDPDAMAQAAKKISENNSLGAILVTMGGEGMVLLKDGKHTHVQAVHNGFDVIDISGAGDTAVAVFSMALAAGAGIEDAMRLANCACGVVVRKFGTATLSQEELKDAVQNTHLGVN